MSSQAQTYHVTDLGTINTNPQTGVVSSHPTGINNAGQVTGYSYSGTSNHAARFTNGLVEDLGVIPGGQLSTGWGINGVGDVVGDSQYSVNGGSIRHAALFRNGTVTDLGILPGWGNYARANGINNLGEVVGHSGTSLDTNVTHAFIWDEVNGMRDLGTLGGGFAKAFSINDSSEVTGRADGPGGTYAFIWDEVNGMRNLGTIAGNFSSGNFINANGHVAGWSLISLDNRRHAFLHDGTAMHDLGAIGDNDFFTDRSEAYGVNIHDVVVGTTYRPYEGGAAYAIAFVYRDGQMLDLETLVDESGANYRLYTATGINDAGQIAVDAIRIGSPNEIRAVLLTPNGMPTPTPPPGSTPTPTPTVTPVATPTPTLTPAPSATPPGATPTSTPTPVSTATPSPTPIATQTPTSTPGPTASPSATAAAPPAQPLNISTRSRVLGGDSALVGGFILTGSDSKQVIIRAIGPSLGANGMPGGLSDTTLDLYDAGGQLLASNDNWRDSQQAQIAVTGIAPGNPLESAILMTLPGDSSYTAVVRGKNGATGIGLVEVYDLGAGANSKLANISTRGSVDTGDNVMIGGFIVGGSVTDQIRVVVRAIGPSLAQFGITNALQDPTLSLYDSNGSVMATNDNWRDGPQPEVVAAGLAPTDDRESALYQSLSPGAYTAIVAGKGGTIGVGLVEAYNIP